MILVPRATIWPDVLPSSSDGSPRPPLAPGRPYLTIHYTGAGLWLDDGDTPTELRSIQAYAEGARKPWEYNYVIDGQGIVYEYAGLYRAAHYADHRTTPATGQNHLAIGVLLLVGLAQQSPPAGFESPTEPMIAAVRDLRAWLILTGMLAAEHQMLPHRLMPGAATMCPGPKVLERWDALTLAVPPPPPPPEEDDMNAATLWRHPAYQNVFLIGAGPAINVSPALFESLVGRSVPVIVDAHELLLDGCLTQAGLMPDDLVPV